ncbi:hypothetical protein ANTPLA_LOCUS10533 [Anthophora plagiata]
MVSYATNIRKTIKWYRKLAIYLLLVTEWLSSKDTVPNPNRPKRRNLSHHLEIRKNQQGKPVRKMCVLCYKKKRKMVERQQARKNLKKTTTYCLNCPKSPQMCLDCFNEFHAT